MKHAFRPNAEDAMSYFVGAGAMKKATGDDFFDATSKRKTTVEYTFGYRRNEDGKLRIFLHHSSVPYSSGIAAPTPKISKQEVLQAQKDWANSIKDISKIYLNGGDYVGAASTAAGKLYGYGHCNVLFKPTK